MRVGVIRHRGLRRLIEHGETRYLAPDMVDRISGIVASILLAEDMDEFIASVPRGWRVHQLSGNRGGVWSVSVSRNWRITFEVQRGEVTGLDLEDYH